MNRTKLMFVSMVSAVLVVVLIGGATFALFTANTTNTGNTFTAGTVKMELGIPAGATYTQLSNELFDIDEAAPGDPDYVREVVVANTGTLDFYFRFNHDRTDISADSVQAAKDDALAAALLMKIEKKVGSTWVNHVPTTIGEFYTVKGWTDWQWTPAETLAAGEVATYRITIRFPITIGNEAQGGHVTTKVDVRAIQVKNTTNSPADWNMAFPGM